MPPCHPGNSFAAAAAALPLLLAAAPVAAPYTSFSTVTTNAYFTGDINSCAFQVNNLTTAGDYQFAAYYDTARRLMIARRAVGSSTWATFNSGFAVSSSEIADDHNVIAMAVDSAGYMHRSWNMHNVSLNYATSSAPVTAASLPSLTFTQRSVTNAPHSSPTSLVRTLTLQGPADGSITGTIQNGTTGATLTIAKAGAGTWTRSGANTYTGPNTVTAGVLVLTARAFPRSPPPPAARSSMTATSSPTTTPTSTAPSTPTTTPTSTAASRQALCRLDQRRRQLRRRSGRLRLPPDRLHPRPSLGASAPPSSPRENPSSAYPTSPNSSPPSPNPPSPSSPLAA